REVNHSVEAIQMPAFHGPHVDPQRGNLVNPRAEYTLAKQLAVQPDHLVTGAEQHRHHDGADITLMPWHQDPHGLNCPSLSAPVSAPTPGALHSCHTFGNVASSLAPSRSALAWPVTARPFGNKSLPRISPVPAPRCREFSTAP